MKKQNIFALLKKDHEKVSQLFSKIEKAGDKAVAKKETLYAKIREELTIHSFGEEKAVYPLLKENEKTQDIGWESVEEHGVVKYLFSKIDAATAGTPDWKALVTVLKEVVEHHVEEEESEMFSKMRKAFSKEELDLMGVNFVKAKKMTNVKELKAKTLHKPAKPTAGTSMAMQ